MNYNKVYQNCKRSYILLKNTQDGGKTPGNPCGQTPGNPCGQTPGNPCGQTPGNPCGLKSIKHSSRDNNKVIIHISGPSGSGKTTLGNKLKEEFSDNIIVKDIDDLRREFIKEYYGEKKWTIIDKDAYQKYIDKYVNEHNKPIVFVGLNHMPWWHKNHYYDMHSTHNYYIDIDDATIIKQRCLRLIRELPDDFNDEVVMNDLINNNKMFLRMTNRAINMDCNAKMIIKMNKKWNNDYKKQGYNFMQMEDIFKDVSIILNKTHDKPIKDKLQKKFVLLDGPSSSGKTSICKFLSGKGYECISGDTFINEAIKRDMEFYKTVKNEYVPVGTNQKIQGENIASILADESTKHKKVAIDWIEQKYIIAEFKKRNLDLFVIVVHASLEDIIKRLEKRRKTGDTRGIFAFEHFSERYMKTDGTNDLGIYNRKKFKKLLLDNLKYLFTDENDLNGFADHIFHNMGIDNDENYYLKLRDEYEYDYFLNTTDKSVEDVLDEISKIL